MAKIKGRTYKRVAKKKSGGCPKGAKRFRRGKTSGCYKPVAKPKKRRKRSKRR